MLFFDADDNERQGFVDALIELFANGTGRNYGIQKISDNGDYGDGSGSGISGPLRETGRWPGFIGSYGRGYLDNGNCGRRRK
jgi:hypothetical protein